MLQRPRSFFWIGWLHRHSRGRSSPWPSAAGAKPRAAARQREGQCRAQSADTQPPEEQPMTTHPGRAQRPGRLSLIRSRRAQLLFLSLPAPIPRSTGGRAAPARPLCWPPPRPRLGGMPRRSPPAGMLRTIRRLAGPIIGTRTEGPRGRVLLFLHRAPSRQTRGRGSNQRVRRPNPSLARRNPPPPRGARVRLKPDQPPEKRSGQGQQCPPLPLLLASLWPARRPRSWWTKAPSRGRACWGGCAPDSASCA
mmetsp:Transcript_32944/g.105062  ORF Transcript_32944/g.105062 Transcript_32944/m.105062 type:complete len:251 (+) Transcript_32944:378-1130(+)